MIRGVLRYRLVLDPDGIRFTGLWGQARALPFSRFEGMRMRDAKDVQLLVLVPKDRALKPAKITFRFERSTELRRRLGEHLRDLDADDYEAELAAIGADRSFGASEGDRLAALGRAARSARVYFYGAMAVGVWGLYAPRPYLAVVSVLVGAPLVSVWLMRTSRGLIVLNSSLNGPRPNVALALLAPAGILAVRALSDWHLLSWSGFWLPFAGFSAISALLVSLGAGWTAARRPALAPIIVLFALVQGYGEAVVLNGVLDGSAKRHFSASVLSREVSRGGGTFYYLTVTPWPETREARKSKSRRPSSPVIRREAGSRSWSGAGRSAWPGTPFADDRPAGGGEFGI